jgi:dipeptidyl aminopeptidase/acylaminoacyl peptidase
VSPINHAAKFKAPVLLLHGTSDDVVPSTQSALMKEALRKAGKQVELKTAGGGGHDWDPYRLYLLTEMERFVTQHIGK